MGCGSSTPVVGEAPRVKPVGEVDANKQHRMHAAEEHASSNRINGSLHEHKPGDHLNNSSRSPRPAPGTPVKVVASPQGSAAAPEAPAPAPPATLPAVPATLTSAAPAPAVPAVPAAASQTPACPIQSPSPTVCAPAAPSLPASSAAATAPPAALSAAAAAPFAASAASPRSPQAVPATLPPRHRGPHTSQSPIATPFSAPALEPQHPTAGLPPRNAAAARHPRAASSAADDGCSTNGGGGSGGGGASEPPATRAHACPSYDFALSPTTLPSRTHSLADGQGDVASPGAAVDPRTHSAVIASQQRRRGEAKSRRAGAGSEAVRDQIRKLVVGGPQSKEEQGRVYEVSDSDEEALLSRRGRYSIDMAAGRLPSHGTTPPEVVDAICSGLRKNFIFSGCTDDLLHQVVVRMQRRTFPPGITVVQQGALPAFDDCMYFLEAGEAEVVITGAMDAAAGEAQRRVEGHAVRIPQQPGWVFGDVALLFNSARTASVVAKTEITTWSLDRTTFLKFVLNSAPGARALRFVRRVPLLKGLSDNDLIRVAKRMPQRVYRSGEKLIQYGERGDEMYLVRYGKVRVLVPADGGKGRLEVAVLGRGQFVGERSVINDKLRSADCVAEGDVQVVVLRKRDFLDLDNPLLAWMMDYDAVSAVLLKLPAFKALKQEQMENILDRFDARQELHHGDLVLRQGELVDKLFVVKMGEVVLLKDGKPASDPSFVREAGGFTFFGDASLDAVVRSPYSVAIASDIAHLLSLPRAQLDSFLGAAAGAGLQDRDAVLAALRTCRSLAALRPEDLAAIVDASSPVRYHAGEVVTPAGPAPVTRLLLVRSGEVLLLPAAPPLAPDAAVDLSWAAAAAVGRLGPGELYNERVLTAPPRTLDAHLVAAAPDTVVVSFELAAISKALSTSGALRRGLASGASSARAAARAAAGGDRRTSGERAAAAAGVVAAAAAAAGAEARPVSSVRFCDLEHHRVVGTGQFGLVRAVCHVTSGTVYALKVMYKAPFVDAKQIEHVKNERAVLGEVNHPFLVQLLGAYQDEHCLYLLQEWVPGGELFHHLDVEGSFSDAVAAFYAANVLLALEALHKHGVVYRDLKPENLLLDTQGYIKMADFGFAKRLNPGDRTYTICGTPDYQAPEVIMRKGTTKAADYWALGVLIFEMLVGDPPFKSLTGDPWDTFRRTLSGRFYVPHFISDAAADLIFKLLQVNPEKRLGSGPGGADDIKSHRWFSRIDWDALASRQIPAPIVPRVLSPLDTSNFDVFDDSEAEGQLKGGQVGGQRAERQQVWEGFDWVPAREVVQAASGATLARLESSWSAAEL